MADWQKLLGADFTDFTFECIDGQIHYSKFVLNNYSYFQTLFHFEKMAGGIKDYLVVDALRETVAKILLFPKPESDFAFSLEILQLAHMWNFKTIINEFFMHIFNRPLYKYLQWEMYFDSADWNQFLRMLFYQATEKNDTILLYGSDKIFEICNDTRLTAKLSFGNEIHFRYSDTLHNSLEVLVKMLNFGFDINTEKIVRSILLYEINNYNVKEILSMMIIFRKCNNTELNDNLFQAAARKCNL